MVKRVGVIGLALIMVMGAIRVFGAETKVEGRIYSTWMLDQTDGKDNYNVFDLGRSYVTAKSKLSDYTSVTITMDLRQTKIKDTLDNTQGLDYSGYTMTLKYAYASWKPEFAVNYLTLFLGLQPTKYLEAIDGSFWGRRYVEKSAGDLNKFLSTSDLGATVNLGLGKQATYGNAGLSVLNGNGYTDITEKNKEKDFNAYAIIKLIPNNPDFENVQLAGQYYTGYQNRAWDSSHASADYKHELYSVGGKFAYQKYLDLGFDLNWNKLGQGMGKDEKKQSAYSAFGTLYLGPLVGETSIFRTLDIFGRVDIADPNTDESDDGNTYVIAGLECAPIKGIMASLNYRLTTPEDSEVAKTKGIYFNSEFRF
jgi:hypothetical protein